MTNIRICIPNIRNLYSSTKSFFEPTPAPSFPVPMDWEYTDRPAVAEDHRTIGFAPSISEEETAPIDDNDQEEDQDSCDWGSGWEVDSVGRYRRYSKRLRK